MLNVFWMEYQLMKNHLMNKRMLYLKYLVSLFFLIETQSNVNLILSFLVLDVKLEMTILRIENGTSYVQLNLGERNLNTEIRALLPQSSSSSSLTVREKNSEK